VARLRRCDAALTRVIDAVGPCALRPHAAASVFGALAEAIVYQQLRAAAARAIFARLCARCGAGRGAPSAASILDVSEPELRAAGLSRQKILALRDLAAHRVDGRLPELAEIRELDDATIVERLTTVRGVGRWTVEMLLIFRLARPDVLPATDLGIRRGLARVTRRRALPGPADVERRGERWRPYRSVASWYLWRAAERD